jgi:hypothetical protein
MDSGGLMEAMTTADKDLSRLVVDLQTLPGIKCVCGIARRAFTDESRSPSSFHVTDITCDAQKHFHKITTEIIISWNAKPEQQWNWTAISFPCDQDFAF